MKLHIVTDSSAWFTNPRMLAQYPVTVIPNRIQIAGKTYKEGVDLPVDEMMRLIATQSKPPKIIPPSVGEFAAAYTQVSHIADAIVSIHPSREINASWHNAREASQQVAGSRPIAVIDSRSVCIGQGLLVKFAWQLCQTMQEEAFDTIVQMIRSAVERIYTQYFVESLAFVQQNRLMDASHALLAMMLGVKPILSIEEGKMQVVEKVRTRSQAIDRLVEFVSEFEALEDVAIVQFRPHITEQTRILQDRLATVFPGRHFPYTLYSASLAALLGTDAIGVVVLEQDMTEDFE